VTKNIHLAVIGETLQRHIPRWSPGGDTNRR